MVSIDNIFFCLALVSVILLVNIAGSVFLIHLLTEASRYRRFLVESYRKIAVFFRTSNQGFKSFFNGILKKFDSYDSERDPGPGQFRQSIKITSNTNSQNSSKLTSRYDESTNFSKTTTQLDSIGYVPTIIINDNVEYLSSNEIDNLSIPSLEIPESDKYDNISFPETPNKYQVSEPISSEWGRSINNTSLHQVRDRVCKNF